MKQFLKVALISAMIYTGANALIEVERTDSFYGGVYNLVWNNTKFKLTTYKNIKNEKGYEVEVNGQITKLRDYEIENLIRMINQKLIDKSVWFALPSKLNEVKYGNEFVDDGVDDFIRLLEKVELGKKQGVITDDNFKKIF